MMKLNKVINNLRELLAYFNGKAEVKPDITEVIKTIERAINILEGLSARSKM